MPSPQMTRPYKATSSSSSSSSALRHGRGSAGGNASSANLVTIDGEEVNLDELEFDDPRLVIYSSAYASSSFSSSSSSSSYPAVFSSSRASSSTLSGSRFGDGDGTSYIEKRRRDIARGVERGLLNQRQQQVNGKGRKRVEEEAREEGLRTNLIKIAQLREEKEKDDRVEGESEGTNGGKLYENKAFKMMKGMGFKPGQALGRKRSPSPSPPVPPTPPKPRSLSQSSAATPVSEESEGGGESAIYRQASSSKNKATSEPQSQARTEPIEIHIRQGRAGLGVPSATTTATKGTGRSSGLPSPAQLAVNAAAPLPDVDTYLAHIRDTVDVRRAHGLLRSVRRTCEELDTRAGVKDNLFWRDPDRGSDANDVFAVGEVGFESKTKRRRLDYDKGVSTIVIDDLSSQDSNEGEEAQQDGGIKNAEDEEARWSSLDDRKKLGMTLQYLRGTYRYCFWCGCQYEDEADMQANCPGEAEADH